MTTYRIAREHDTLTHRIVRTHIETVVSRAWAEDLAAQYRLSVAADECPSFRRDRIIVVEEAEEAERS